MIDDILRLFSMLVPYYFGGAILVMAIGSLLAILSGGWEAVGVMLMTLAIAIFWPLLLLALTACVLTWG